MTESGSTGRGQSFLKRLRSDRGITTLGVIVSILGIFASIYIPEVRGLLGLDRPPILQKVYIGTDTPTGQQGFPMRLTVMAQNAESIGGYIHFDRSQYSDCIFSGTVTSGNEINLTCKFSASSLTFTGSIDRDHIKGTSRTGVSNDPYNFYTWDLTASKESK